VTPQPQLCHPDDHSYSLLIIAFQGFNEYLGWLVFDAEGIFSGFLDGEADTSWLRGLIAGRSKCRIKCELCQWMQDKDG